MKSPHFVFLLSILMRNQAGGEPPKSFMDNESTICNPHSAWKSGPELLLLVVVLGLVAGTAQAARAQTLSTLYSFRGAPDGSSPSAGLIMDPQGNLYGTTQAGGAYGYSGYGGTVFKLTPTGSEKLIHSFPAFRPKLPPSIPFLPNWLPDGVDPYGGLITDGQGNLYGTTLQGGNPSNNGAVFEVTRTGLEITRYVFTGYPNDGSFPAAGLVMDAQGNLYGTTEFGGAFNNCGSNPPGCGAVFKLTPTGTEVLLHSFSGYPNDGSDGHFSNAPMAGLILDAQGNLYGTTPFGGASSNCGSSGCGTVFEVTPDAVETVLHNFIGPDGLYPSAPVLMDAQGNLYGTTINGGGSPYYFQCCGTVFKLTPTGVETVLYTFCKDSGCTDGAFPVAGLVMDAQGNLYGTTLQGGAYDGCGFNTGCGTVFKLTPSGTETVLHSFCTMSGCADGSLPAAALIMDSQGDLYGTTQAGGNSNCPPYNGCGTVFKLTPN